MASQGSSSLLQSVSLNLVCWFMSSLPYCVNALTIIRISFSFLQSYYSPFIKQDGWAVLLHKNHALPCNLVGPSTVKKCFSKNSLSLHQYYNSCWKAMSSRFRHISYQCKNCDTHWCWSSMFSRITFRILRQCPCSGD